VVFEFATGTRIRFGAGTQAEVPEVVRGLGVKRILLVTGRTTERAERLRRSLLQAEHEMVELAVAAEPSVDLVRMATQRAIAQRCEAVVAFGGGSAIDAGKAVAALVANRGDPRDYLEGIGRRTLDRPSLPLVALPTTAGTGAEVTRNAVLLSRHERTKASLRSPYLAPTAAIIDPDLLVGTPPPVVLANGFCALSQLIEPFLSPKASPLTDAWAREGIFRSVRSLRRSVLEPPDDGARQDLALAGLLGGLCLANAGLGAIHAFAVSAGGMLEVPHGALCAALLGPVLAVNLRALLGRAPNHPALHRFGEVAALLTGRPTAEPAQAVTWVEAIARELGVPGLGRMGLAVTDIPGLVERAKRTSSLRSNPIELSDEELTEIAHRSLASG
jgi:alcohol dehydrogenase class IV